ncbi:MAG: Uma2 family endonuclease [Lewinellaceae bacterium]|nr:Uma2 family endonuclease [Lewinellaceae bacterium]
MTTDIETRKYSIEEYFALEAEAKEKLEYFNGKIRPMPGGTPLHNEIASNVIYMLKALIKGLKQRKFKLYNSDMKIWIEDVQHFVYPDAVVVAEKPTLYPGRKDIITNPLLIVEVLSPGTEDYDRNDKFLEYRTIPSFMEYVCLRQDAVAGVAFYREEEALWRESNAFGTGGVLPLRSLGVELPLDKVYEEVEFE